jgi:serine/threonine protein kinase
MALVVLAHDQELSRPVAIKLLDAGLARDDGLRERFLREARLAARLAHPNVVKVYDAGEEDDRPYIVMECVDGETLADVLARQGPLAFPEAVRLALEACAGLEHAHAAGLVHRDVKPQNLLVRADGTLKIADFGIARALESTRVTQEGTVLGTGAYLSPEQAAGGDVTHAADLYSLGVVLYELLTGRTPYTYESLARLAHEQATRPVEPIRDLVPAVPARLEDVVMRCLARNPAYRPRSASALADDLRTALSGGDRTAATEPLVAYSHKVRPRRAWLLASAVALLTAGVAGVAVALSRDGDPTPAPPSRVEPVSQADTAAGQARNLAAWLRENAR